MDAIRTEGLTKHFAVGFWRPRPHLALDRLDLRVAAGDVFGFLGPNGAGKTTTLKLLMQLIFPSAGTAEILGRPVGDVQVRRRIGYLPENPYFYDYLTADELLVYFGGLFGYPAAECRTRAARLLDDVGIGAERRLQLRKFSKGMLQRVGIAQALINDPEVVFLDEPMSGLDPLGRRDIRQLILRLRDRGCTVFFSSHVLSDAQALCNRVAVLAKGRLVASGALSEILDVTARGWELVIAGASDAALARAAAAGATYTPLGDGRYSLDVPVEVAPERLLTALVEAGAQPVSLSPVQETLEDFFVRQVESASADRGLARD
jgi:ABC-2 type transport system ATP-binding protein